MTSRGVTTLFDDITAVVSVRGGVARHVLRSPSWSRVKNIEYIEGGTLSRVSVRETIRRGVFTAIVKRIPESQRKIGCDQCRQKHRPTNARCSATIGVVTHATATGHLYDFETGRDCGVWATSEEAWLRSSTVGRATYSRV